MFIILIIAVKSKGYQLTMLKLSQYASLTGLLLFTSISLPLVAAEQCITSPKRIYACDNMIYTNLITNQEKRLICVCKSDKSDILSLLSNDQISTQRIEIRKLLAKHQLTRPELMTILKQIN